MKKCIAFFLLGISWQLAAQKNAVFYELGGNGGWMSINYERQLTKDPKIMLRLGLGFSPFEVEFQGDESSPYANFLNFPAAELSVPVSAHYLLHFSNENYLDMGLGYTWQQPTDNPNIVNEKEKALHLFYSSIMYRNHFGRNESWMWKIGLTPRIASNEKLNGPDIWAGLVIGKRF